jgi:hypothetical protein
MNSPCEHRRLSQLAEPCKLHDVDPEDPQCCWAQCADCGGMLHMLRVMKEEVTDLDEIVDFE